MLEYVINPKNCEGESPIGKFVNQFMKPNGSAIDNAKDIIPYCVYLFLARPFIKYGIHISFNTYRKLNAPGKRSTEHYFAIFKDDSKKILSEKCNYQKEILDIYNCEEKTDTDQSCYNTYKPMHLDKEITFLNNFLKIAPELLFKEAFRKSIEEICLNVCGEMELRFRSVTKIVFHPSYTYEDFVGGIKPDLVQTKSKDPSVPLTYKYTPGVMLDLIRKAWGNKGERYYLIIDEFNRGNIAAIFGEFLYLIENDKRSKDKNSGVDYVFLPGGVYPWDDKEKVEPFSEECKIRMPENIFIVGALNTADRSIATMDFAMRRRFNFVKFEPNEELIKGFNWENTNTDTDTDVTGNVQRLFISLNRSIKYKLDADHEIGHYYFMHADGVKKDTEAFLKDLFERKIIPLLEAYCDHDEQAVKIILVLTNILMKARENGTPPALISLDNLKKLTAKQIKSDYWNGLKDSAEKNISGLYEALIKLVNSNSGTVSTEGETNDGNK